MSDSGSRKYGVAPRGKRWIAKPYVNGEHVWVGTFDEEDEALRAAIKRYDELKRLPTSKETVQRFADRWVEDYPRDESTNDHYRTMAKLFAREYGDRKSVV